MSPWKIAALLAVVPAAALAQSNALDAARGTAQTQQAGVQREAQLVEPAFAEPAAPQAAQPAVAPQAPGGATVDLTKAAEQLEGGAGEEEVPVEQAQPASGGSAPETYTVKKGDTLWDLSGRYLDSPWYWPKLWSYNPEIANPHWIYPGNVLRFYPAGEQAPARVEPAAAPALAPMASAAEEYQAPKELDDLTRGNIHKAELLDEEDAVLVVGPYKVAPPKPKGAAVQRNSFVTAKQLESAATIVAAFEAKLILSTGDKIYAQFRDPGQVKVGQKYSIYRADGPVIHPVTNETYGYKTVILGTARVTATEPGKASTLVISYVNDGVERGDLLGPSTEQALKPIFYRPNHASVQGYVIGVQPAIVTGAAEYNVVYLDKGKADGVEVGNTFVVVRSGDPLSEPIDRPLNTPGLPREVIGEVVVFDSQDRASSAYVRRSLAELLVGDHVEMRPESPAGNAGKQGG
ncbi:MAG TPA: LysM peptidoglycan-binding domain-containing protein [Anaeromyxobacteraceae bacterium]|nr:LysM peptidoglycan-binding domain-containing protein [Anaeromyxobacteraceae bacterium]